MKTSYKYFAFATIAILLCSCNKDITTDTIDSRVQISAKIAPCIVTRVTDDGTAFSNGDAIKVQNVDRESKNLATYTYSSSTGKWSTSDELYWGGESENTFNAWYPADAKYGSFTIPSDQTTGTAAADWMTATTSAKNADRNVELSFNHNLAKVTVTIEKWVNGYTANEQVVNSLEINSLSSTMSNDGNLSGDNVAKWIKTSISQANTSYVALVAPGTYSSEEEIMQVHVNGSSTALKVKTTSSIVVKSGKAYSFKLIIGKDLAAISSSVIVGEWDEETLENQQTTSDEIKRINYIDEYDVNHGEGVEIDGITWAPVNCGYHVTDYPYGKLYQWGRKYGQGYSESDDATVPIIKEERVSVTVGNDVSNSNVFYKVQYYYDWVNPWDGTLWNSGSESNPIKTDYDPCPDGWRVPTYAELNKLYQNHSSWTTNNVHQNGYWFCGGTSYINSISKVFLSAAGERANSDGFAHYRNNSGYYWSSGESNGDSYCLNFSNSGIYISLGHRAYAYSVRCVQE